MISCPALISLHYYPGADSGPFFSQHTAAALARAGPSFSSARAFWRRRALRIVPMMWAAVALFVGLAKLGGRPIKRCEGARALAETLLGVQNLRHDRLDELCLGHLWTLGVELQLALVAPVLAALFGAANSARGVRRGVLPVAAAVLAVCIGVRAVAVMRNADDMLYPPPTAGGLGLVPLLNSGSENTFARLYIRPVPRAIAYVTGMAAHYVIKSPKWNGVPHAHIVSPLAVAAMIVLRLSGHNRGLSIFVPWVNALYIIFSRLVWSLLTCVLYADLISRETLISRALSHPALHPLAALGFPFYIAHPAFIVIGMGLLGFAKGVDPSWVSFGALWAITVAGSLATAMLLHVLVELPGIRLSKLSK